MNENVEFCASSVKSDVWRRAYFILPPPALQVENLALRSDSVIVGEHLADQARLADQTSRKPCSDHDRRDLQQKCNETGHLSRVVQ